MTGPARSPRRAACGTYARSGAPRGRPVAASARIRSRTAGSRSGSAACMSPARPTTVAASPRRVAQPISASVMSRWVRAPPRRWQSPRRRSDRRGPARATAHAPPAAAAAPRPDRAARGCARWRAGPACVTSRSAGSRSRRYPSSRVWRRVAATPKVRAEAGHVGVQGLARRVRHLRRPQRVHEPVDGDRPSFGERQQREHGPPLGPGTSTAPPLTTSRRGPSTSTHPRGVVDCWHRFTLRTDGVSAEKARARSLTLRRSTWLSSPACAGREDREKKDGSPRSTSSSDTSSPTWARPAAGADGHRQPARPLPRLRRARRQPSSSPNAPATTFIPDRMAAGEAAGGYVAYDVATDQFSLTDEQAFCLADPTSRTSPHRPSSCLATCAGSRGWPRRSAPRRNRLARA